MPGARTPWFTRAPGISDQGSRRGRHMSKVKRLTVWLVSMLLILAVIGLYARHGTQSAMLRIIDRPSTVDTTT